MLSFAGSATGLKTDIFMNTSGTHFQFSSDDHKYPGKNFWYYTTSTEMTVHRIAFCELSSNEFFFLGGGGVQLHRIFF